MRTLGGLEIEAAGGKTARVADGLIFRSATLAALSPADGEGFKGLGIRRVIDLRTKGEREAAPDALPEGIEFVSLDVLGDHAKDLSASLSQLGMPGTGEGEQPTPEQAAAISQQLQELLGEGRGVQMLQHSNRLIVSSDSALAAYRSFYELLTEAEYLPTLFHCTTGKDRTGWAAASLLLLLGASEETAMADYLQTNVDIMPMIQPILDRADRGGVGSSLIKPVLTVHESMLQAAIDEMRSRFGTIEGYFTDGLGLSADRLAVLRARFTEEDAA